jgi:hypothetical protein
MAYGVILKHLEVDKITWGHFLKKIKKILRRGADDLFGGKEGLGALFLTGVENTACKQHAMATRFQHCRD